MNNLIEKARTGRTSALVLRQSVSGSEIPGETPVVRFKTTRRNDPVAFISTRAQAQTSVWLH